MPIYKSNANLQIANNSYVPFRIERAATRSGFSHTGFTLVEILITITIFVLVSIAVFNLFSFGQKFYGQGSTQAELLQNGRVILERMAREIRQAQEIVTPLPQVVDNPDNPPPSEIEFQDGHKPFPYEYLGSDYYYIRYYLSTSTGEIYRQYRVYCFDPCSTCNTYFRWNDTRIEGGETIYSHSCNLEEKIIGEYVGDLKFWGAGLIDISLILKNRGQELNLQTKLFGRNF